MHLPRQDLKSVIIQKLRLMSTDNRASRVILAVSILNAQGGYFIPDDTEPSLLKLSPATSIKELIRCRVTKFRLPRTGLYDEAYRVYPNTQAFNNGDE
jgi:hypothetical protein